MKATATRLKLQKQFGQHHKTLHIQIASNAVGTVTIPTFINKLLLFGPLFLFMIFFVIFICVNHRRQKSPPPNLKVPYGSRVVDRAYEVSCVSFIKHHNYDDNSRILHRIDSL